MVESDFDSYPIGQGCFYTGRIEMSHSRNGRFNFEYECGVDRKDKHKCLTDQIKEYRSRISTVLNMVILLHFDWEHVTGVIELLKGIDCKRFVNQYYELFIAWFFIFQETLIIMIKRAC